MDARFQAPRLVQQPPVKLEVRMKDFLSWLGRQGRSPAEVTLKQKPEKIIRQGESREDVNEKGKQTNQQPEIAALVN